METYKGKINEFVDWTTGIDERTELVIDGVSENTKISGQSIRELVLEHLKRPFVTREDSVAGVIRIFSGEEIADEWWKYANPNKDNLYYDIDKANEILNKYLIWQIELPATYRITGLDGFVAARYIIEGNTSSQNAILDLNLGLEDALGSTEFDVLTVSYTITDNTETVRYTASDLIETGQHVEKQIYLYLRSGENKVSITVSSNNHNAKTTKSFSIFLVTFSISSNFTGYYNPVANGVPFSFDIFVLRSITNLPVTTTVYIDGSIARLSDSDRSEAIWRYAENSANPTRRIEIYNPYSSSDYENKNKHLLKIESKMEDPETGTSFYSNILVYEFEVSPTADDLTYSYVNIAISIASGSYGETLVDDGEKVRTLPILKATLYLASTINWGYNTDSYSQLLLAQVLWSIRKGLLGNYRYTTLAELLGVKGTKPDSLTFIPGESLLYDNDNSFLVASIIKNGISTEVAAYPISIEESSMKISEYGNYSLKLSGVGKTNSSDNKNLWIDEENNIYTTFSSGVLFDDSNGWNDNSLILKGIDSYAIIGYCPFPSTYRGTEYNVSNDGATFEIDFKPEYVANEGDVLIRIGNVNRPHIDICTNSAAFIVNNSPIVKTNFKSGERIKLAFVFNRQSEISNNSNLVYIINNGILERTANRGNTPLTDDTGTIKIGGSNSSVRVYQIRAYRQDLSPKLELDNYMFDNSSNTDLLSRNDVYGDSSEITYGGMSGKLDIIVIEGDLTNILANKSSKLNATVNIRRESNSDPDRNFTIENCRIRNHGQSTLSYPITSMKIWFNKSNKLVELIGANGSTSLVEITPNFNCLQLNYLGLNKNRYIMKAGAIPANKFVLQANYADSSGTHNGSLLRLILDTWYNALFGANKQFKLRTAPLLFASGTRITHDNTSLNEDGSWVEGVYNIPISDNNYRSEWANKTWSEITNEEFPYKIRVAADSFPCVIFYKDTSTDQLSLNLLGLYVFMDDKKSDYIYGERSIYYTDDTTDPFCLKVENSKKDKNSNKVWDNNKVLQIEVVYPNSPLTGYVSKYVASSYILDENDNLVPGENATLTRFDDVTARDSNGKPIEYLWEQHFELIYPDKEDITDKNGNFDSDKFATIVQPFEDFLDWITDVASLSNTGSKLGESGSKSYVTLAEMNKFIEEAHDHLDLYKMAAYYVMFLRFGLVDSVERNAQLKTYDGQHFHYEPWDMDVALGCANNGVIAYEPPLTRDSRNAGGGYVFSGRTLTLSNTLWDCLESWDYWMGTIVPEVAQALYDSGLDYNSAVEMFDKQYQEKWSETLYNESGQYKYIEATLEPRYRLYLNGARTSHRHWWLSKSMNYYDAKWECGDFKKYEITIIINKQSNPSNINIIKIYPTSNTFFKLVYGAEGNEVPLGEGLTQAEIENPAVIDVPQQLEDKNPLKILGANSIKCLDLSGFLNSNQNLLSTTQYSSIDVSNSYDPILGALIRELIVGAPTTPNIYEYPNETSYTSNLTVGQNSIVGAQNGNDALENLELLDVIGWWSKTSATGSWLSSLMLGRKNISTVYALGCNMATEFSTSQEGNNFVDLRLPNTIETLTFTNSSWENISFWNTTSITVTKARYDKVGIPASISTITLNGTTARNECSLLLVLDWIDSIETTLPVNHTEEDLYEALENKTLIANQIHWGTGNIHLTFNDVLRLAHFGGVSSLKGYVLITAGQEGLTSAQLTLLQTLFGENVFNIGTTNSNLVVDYSSDTVIISIAGILERLLMIDNNIYIKEPNAATLSANHFTLTAGSSNNYVVDAENNNPNLTDSFTDNKYIWGFVNSLDASLSDPMHDRLSHTRLERGNDGIMRLRTEEGDGNNYTMYIRVMYGKQINGQLRIMSDTIAVNVIAVTYPSDYNWQITGATLSQFRYNSTIATSLFGVSSEFELNGSPIYVFRTPALSAEFSLKPAEAKYYYDLSGQRRENWTANELNETIEYHIAELGNASISSTNFFSGYKNKTEFQTNENKIFDIGTSDYAWATDNSSNGGIPIKVTSTLPSNMILYRIRGRVQIGGLNLIIKTIYFIIINDPTPILRGNLSSLSNIMWGTYCNLYSVQTLSNQNMYKTELISLYGTIDFTSEPTIRSLISDADDTILNYLPYVSGLDFEGCSVLGPTDPQSFENNFRFNNMTSLTTLSFEGCTGLNLYTLDLTNCPELTTINTQNSNVGIILPQGSKITSMLLGSPISITIDNPRTLGSSGTTVSVQSSANLQTLSLTNINQSTTSGYKMFNSIYNPS